MEILRSIWESILSILSDSGLIGLFQGDGWKNAIMIGIACFLLYLAIGRQFEPLLLLRPGGLDVVDQGLQYEGEDDEHGAADEEGQHLGAPLLIIEQEHEGRPEGEHHGRGHERHGQGRHAHSRTVPSRAGPRIFTAVP